MTASVRSPDSIRAPEQMLAKPSEMKCISGSLLLSNQKSWMEMNYFSGTRWGRVRRARREKRREAEAGIQREWSQLSPL